MRGMPVGVQQHHGDRLGPARRHALGQLTRGLLVELSQRAVGTHPLRRSKSQLVTHQRRRVRRAQAI
jgi:hypothetical protein